MSRTERPVTVQLAILALGLLLVGGLGLVSLFAGSKETSVSEVFAVLAGGGDDYVATVVEARVPRTVVGAVVGAALAASGVLIQGLTRNPLGEPGLLGVGVGASAAMVTATAVLGPLSALTTVWVALPGAVLAVLAVYTLGRQAGSTSVVPLLLAGAVVSAVLYAYNSAMVLTRPDVFDSYRFWIVGSLAGVTFDELAAAGVALLGGVLLALFLGASLNTLAMGEEVATSLGVRVPVTLGLGILAATLLAAGATAIAGPIAFVGLAVPHTVRALVGTDFRWQIPACLVYGAAMLLAADIAARLAIRPQELMVGILTAFVGAPFLLVALRRGAVMR